MLRKPASTPVWVRSVAQGLMTGQLQGINGRQGQNLLMAMAVVAMLLLVVPLTLSGYGSSNNWAARWAATGGMTEQPFERDRDDDD